MFVRSNRRKRPQFLSVVRSQEPNRAKVPLWIFCSFLTVAWLLPYHTIPYWSFYNDFVALAGLATAALLASRTASSHVNVPHSTMLPIVVAAVIFLHAVLGHMTTPWDAMPAIGDLLACATAMCLADFACGVNPSLQSRQRVWAAFAIALLAAAIVSTLIEITQYLEVDDLLGDFSAPYAGTFDAQTRPYGNLGQPNQLALLLSWSLAAIWWLYCTGRVGRCFGTCIAALVLTGAVLTQSKITWLIFPLFAALVLIGRRRSVNRHVPAIYILGLLLYFALLVALLPTISLWLSTPSLSIEARLQTNGIRRVMIEQGFYLGWMHPIIGLGWNRFGEGQIDVAPLFGESQYARHAHNFVAQLAAEAGLVLTTCVCVVIVLWMYRRFANKSLTTERLFALMIIVAVAVHSLVEFPLWYAYILVPVGFVVGLVEEEAVAEQVTSRWLISRGATLAVSLVGALVLALVASDYRNVVQAFRAFGFARVGLEYELGSVHRPPFTMFPHFYKYFAFSRVIDFEGLDAVQLDEATQIADRFASAPALLRLSLMNAANGREDEAVNNMIALHNLFRPRYLAAYGEWKALAREKPELYGATLEKLAKP